MFFTPNNMLFIDVWCEDDISTHSELDDSDNDVDFNYDKALRDHDKSYSSDEETHYIDSWDTDGETVGQNNVPATDDRSPKTITSTALTNAPKRQYTLNRETVTKDQSTLIAVNGTDTSKMNMITTTLTNTVMGESQSLYAKKPTKKGCKHIYDKVNFCTFCKKEIKSKIARHILSVHKDDPRVSDIRFLPPRSHERMIQLQVLANEGNFKHNTEVLKGKPGQLVVARRRGHGEKPHQAEDFLPCEFCKLFIIRDNLWQHNRSCNVRLSMSAANDTSEPEEERINNAVRRGKNLLLSALLESADLPAMQMIERMNNDDIKNVVLQDTLIKRYAALRVEALGDESVRKSNDIYKISQGARTLARLVIQSRNEKPCTDLDDLITPQCFDLVVSSTKSMAFEGEKTAVSLGKYVGNLLGHMINIKEGHALRCNDDKRCSDANKFRKMYQAEWNYRVNAIGFKKANKIKRTKTKVIPLTEDLVKLRNFMVGEMAKKTTSLTQSHGIGDWKDLAVITLSRLILFNKRRRAEVIDLTVEDYLGRPCWKETQLGELQMAMSTADRLLAER